MPKPPGPPSCSVVPLDIQFLVVALRRLVGWNEKRMAQELAKRGIAHLSHTTVGRIFARYHLPTRTYHSRARCDGLPKGRYEGVRTTLGSANISHMYAQHVASASSVVMSVSVTASPSS